MTATSSSSAPLNSPARVITASMIGTTIEFYDFYVYATAAVLVFVAANTHLVYVAFASRPDCVPHAKEAGGTTYRAAQSAC